MKQDQNMNQSEKLKKYEAIGTLEELNQLRVENEQLRESLMKMKRVCDGWHHGKVGDVDFMGEISMLLDLCDEKTYGNEEEKFYYEIGIMPTEDIEDGYSIFVETEKELNGTGLEDLQYLLNHQLISNSDAKNYVYLVHCTKEEYEWYKGDDCVVFTVTAKKS